MAATLPDNGGPISPVSALELSAPDVEELHYHRIEGVTEDDSSTDIHSRLAQEEADISSHKPPLSGHKVNGESPTFGPTPRHYRHDNVSYGSSSRHGSNGLLERDFSEEPPLYSNVTDGLFPSISTAKLMSHETYLKNRPEPLIIPGLSSESRRVMRKGYDLGFSSPKLRALYEVMSF